MPIHTRRFPVLAAALLALGVAANPLPAAAADFAQVPGVYRQAIGDLQVTALFDGVALLPVQQLKGMPPAKTQATLNTYHVPQTQDGVQTAVNAYLVRRDGELLLVDTGTADCFGPALGQVLGNLRAAGVRPEDVRHVLLTHAHPDHLCGVLTADGQMAYPNATLWLSEADARYWLDPATRDRSPEAMHPLFDMARRAVAPYQAAGHFKAVGDGDALPAGVERVATPGHTPGHTSWRVHGSGQASLLVWGDVVHYHAVQLRHPEAAFEYDSDRRQAVASRKRLLAEVAERGEWVAGAHLPFPGIGHVVREGRRSAASYRWVPTEFGPIGKP